jgi:hypothetical protein
VALALITTTTACAPLGYRRCAEPSPVRLEAEPTKLSATPDDDAWVALSYAWDRDGRDATAAPEGVENARGTPHDVPPARTCMGCHGGTPSRVLGFGAIQLASADDDAMSLERLEREDRLTSPARASLRVPGDATTRRRGSRACELYSPG